MTKRILATFLCVVLLCGTLSGCAKSDDEIPGAYITMYLTDDIYDFDPANAYYNTDAINVLSMMYDTLFRLDENGKVKKSLVDSYKIVENEETDEYYIEFTLKEAYWSVQDQVTANDVVYAWKRLVDFRNDYEAASLLFDIKNARAVKEGDVSIDDLGVEAVEDRVVRVSFEAPIDYDQFFLNLTSVATAPLLERYVSANPDWAKKSSTIATSGPFKLGRTYYEETGETVADDNAMTADGSIVSKSDNKVKRISYFYLERNLYYYRDTERDSLDKTVKPYRLLVDCSKTPEQLLEDFRNNRLFYIGSIPLSLRTGADAAFIQEEAEVSDALSTFVCYLNENALIDDGGNGSYLFANTKVRQALSLAIDRTAIAQAVVFAEAATALVPTGVFDRGTKGEFRTSDLAADLIAANANLDQARTLLSEAGITPADYSFSIKVAAYDDVHVAIVEMVKNAWVELGFNVTVEQVSPIENNDYFDQTESTPPDVCDDLFIESLQRGKFEVIAFDETAFSADAYSVLSNYAYAFCGSMYSDPDRDVYEYSTHITGYDSVSYNILMEAVYYLPYFATLENDGSTVGLNAIYTTQPYVESAASAQRKLTEAVELLRSATETLSAGIATDEEGVAAMNLTALRTATETLRAQVEAMELAGKQAAKNIVAAQASAETTTATQTAANAASTAAREALSAAEAAVEAADSASTDDMTAALESAQAAVTAMEAVLSAGDAAVAAMQSAAATVSTQNLYDAVKAVYDANGITPTTKTSEWAKQRSTLLHKAEEQLMTDMPVIPIVYNQNAVLVGDDISRVSATYYAPANFQKTKLKDYKDYYYTDESSGKTESIFKNFPEIAWDKKVQ